MSAESKVIKFAFLDHIEYEENGKPKHRARCKFCPQKNILSDVRGTTSNFYKHLKRVHKNK